MKTIGILGGMGPQATAELYLRIIRIFQQDYGAKYDDDFPEMIILNLPIPDVVERPSQEIKVKQMLVEGAKKLEIAGGDFIVIPCNTVTKYLRQMKESVSIPIISIVEETIRQTASLRDVGILATELTIKSNLYPGMIYPEKNVQECTTKIIMNILAGRFLEEDRKFLLSEIERLQQKGAEKVILGCTELPLLVRMNDNALDTINILAEATVKRAIDI